MPLRVAIVGPGRVGGAIARRLLAASSPDLRREVEWLGFVGRDPQATAVAAAAAGGGTVLRLPDLQAAHLVVFAVPDPALAEVLAAALEAGAARSCALWLHTSGRFGLEVFPAQALAAGLRLGALHPATPIPAAASGAAALAGAPAVLLAGPGAERLLTRFASLLGMQPLPITAGDRTAYHAACALAANGVTALRGLVDTVLAACGGVPAATAARLADHLMNAALAACREHGPSAALSGPVRRGDRDTVAAHLAALAARAPEALLAYRALMLAALPLAQAAGLPVATAAPLATLLAQAIPAVAPAAATTAGADPAPPRAFPPPPG